MKSLTIISGVAPNLNIGAGRLVHHLVNEALTWGPSTEIVLTGNKSDTAAAFRRKQPLNFLVAAIRHYCRRAIAHVTLPFLAKRQDVVILHFQEIGIQWCAKFLELRREPTWIYILDASFFCIRSYNHLPGETTECLRCKGGNFTQAVAHGCKPFPIADRGSLDFLRKLQAYVSCGHVRLLAQNENHAKLMRSHFGSAAIVRTVGLWTFDMSDVSESPEIPNGPEVDVVFHADAKDAKGFSWAIHLAALLSDLKFLFPCSRPSGCDAPANCIFIEMRWESGLRSAVRRARVTLVPSIWSAPIESALVKSISNAPRVATIMIETGYSAELHEKLVCHLDPDPILAAPQLLNYLKKDPTSRLEVDTWFAGLRTCARLVECISNALEDNDEPRC